jgi:putative ABC transport system permease protein
VAAVLDEIAMAVRLVALFTLGTGLVVTAGALTATRSQRLYESVVLRTLGATRGVVARAFAVEYGLLGLVAGLGSDDGAPSRRGSSCASFSTCPRRSRRPVGVALLATVALAVSVGFLSTFRLLGRKPLPVLRAE